jgi:hypothetical protein
LTDLLPAESGEIELGPSGIEFNICSAEGFDWRLSSFEYCLAWVLVFLSTAKSLKGFIGVTLETSSDDEVKDLEPCAEGGIVVH